MLGHESEELILQDELNAKWVQLWKEIINKQAS
jgi:hypothetical protein